MIPTPAHGHRILPAGAGGGDWGRAVVSAAVLIALVMGAVGCGGDRDDLDDVAFTGTGGQPARVEPPVITVTLPGEPAKAYRAGGEEPLTGALSRELEQRFPGLRTTPCLARAAGIYGRTAQADRLPLAFLEFALHWSGCPDPFAAVAHVLTDDDGDEAFFEELETILDSVEATHIGVARTPAREPYTWRWTVFLTERDVELQPVPTSVAPGSSVALVVRFLRPVDGASVVSTRPDGEVVSNPAGLSGDRMLAAVEIADRPGTQWIEVVAEDASGPHVVLLFPVEVGREPSRAWIGTRRQDESWITDPVAAEAHAYSLLDHDRARFGLPTLLRDEVLASVARGHSSEMAATGRVTHLSPTTGSVIDRLGVAGYEAGFAMENISRSSSIADAQEGLMRSPAHRAAVLSTRVSRVGIGIVTRTSTEEGTVHFMTQVFADPVE